VKRGERGWIGKKDERTVLKGCKEEEKNIFLGDDVIFEIKEGKFFKGVSSKESERRAFEPTCNLSSSSLSFSSLSLKQ